MKLNSRTIALLISTPLVFNTIAMAQDRKYPEPDAMTPGATEIWLPQPRIVAPTAAKDPTGPPSDAVVLLGPNGDLSAWQHANGSPAGWDIKGGEMTVKAGTGDILTRESFGDCQIHLEWRAPIKVVGESQGRGNSGMFLQQRYEVQILDNYNNETYANGQAASVYKQSPPLVNAMRAPGEWNVYDVIFTAPRFKDNGTIFTPARVTVIHNGVVVQNNTLISGPTQFIGVPRYTEAHGDAPIQLQDHGNPVSFRNIWIRKL